MRIDRQRAGDRFHDAGNFSRKRLFQVSGGYPLAKAPFGDVGGDTQGGIHAHVRLDQQLFQAFQHGVIQHPLVFVAPQQAAQKTGLFGGGCGLFRRACDQILEPRADLVGGAEHLVAQFLEERHGRRLLFLFP